ncbi:MAG: transposase [Verrucomicrobiales bacterium]|nr:transposase [Verrucomicrobiales bacterium]
MPQELHDFFELNYRVAATVLFASAAETLKEFQKNNWGVDGGFFGVFHSWGSALNWHPHLHVLVSSGGVDRKAGKWKDARSNYLFAVKAMSKVFGAIMLKRIEDLDGDEDLCWPKELESVESRRDWRLRLAGKNWNIFSKATLGNTRAVVRYLARYTSKIAMSNSRILEVDEENRTVKFEWKNYRAGGRKEQREMDGRKFVRSFARHLVPKGLRRVRYYGWLAGAGIKKLEEKVSGVPKNRIGERAVEKKAPPCPNCEGIKWKYLHFYRSFDFYGYKSRAELKKEGLNPYSTGRKSFSLVLARASP